MDGIVSLLTTTEGRISRKQWWIGLLVIVAIAIGLTIVLSIISFGNLLLLSWGGFIISLALLWPSYCIGMTTGEVWGQPALVPDMWLMVLQFLVFVFAVYMLVQVGFLKGTEGPNQYGPDPLATA